MSTVFFSYRPKLHSQCFALVATKEDFYDVKYSVPPLKPLSDQYRNILVAGGEGAVWMGLTVSPCSIKSEQSMQPSSSSSSPLSPPTSARRRKIPNQESRKTDRDGNRGRPTVRKKKTASTQMSRARRVRYEPNSEPKAGRIAIIVPHRRGKELSQQLQEMKEEMAHIRHRIQVDKIQSRKPLDSGLKSTNNVIGSESVQSENTHELKGQFLRLTATNGEISDYDRRLKKLEEIVISFLTNSSATPLEYLQEIHMQSANEISAIGFNLLLGDLTQSLYFYSDLDKDQVVYELVHGEYCFDSSVGLERVSMDHKFREIIEEILKDSNANGTDNNDTIRNGLSDDEIIAAKSEQSDVKGTKSADILSNTQYLHRIWTYLDCTQFPDDEFVDTGLDILWEKRLSAMLTRTGVYGARQSFIFALSRLDLSDDETKSDQLPQFIPYRASIHYKHYYVPDLSFFKNSKWIDNGEDETSNIEGSNHESGSSDYALSQKKRIIHLPVDRQQLTDSYTINGDLSRQLLLDNSLSGQSYFEIQIPVPRNLVSYPEGTYRYSRTFTQSEIQSPSESIQDAKLKESLQIRRNLKQKGTHPNKDYKRDSYMEKRETLEEQTHNRIMNKIPLSQLAAKIHQEQEERILLQQGQSSKVNESQKPVRSSTQMRVSK